jgi:hypothetical protein
LRRDNRWRRTLPEAIILFWKLLGLSTSKVLDLEFEIQLESQISRWPPFVWLRRLI